MTENIDKTINYIEFPLRKPAETRAFYEALFGWAFTERGPNYLSFSGAGIEGGFNGEDKRPVTGPGTLVVLYADDLAATEERVRAAGVTINHPIYGFPGGRRFHFLDPNGNELAVWSATKP